MPVTTCMMKQQRAALPKTYHQRASRGTACFIRGPMVSDAPVRSSMKRHAVDMVDLIVFNMARASVSERCSAQRNLRIESRQRDRAGLDFDLAGAHADEIPSKRFGRRAGGDGAVFVVDTAVAGAHEELCALDPRDRATDVTAVDAEGEHLIGGHAAQPSGGYSGDGGP